MAHDQKQKQSRFASPLRYPGGKGRLGPWFASILEHNDLTGGWFVEPYAGGAGVALYLLTQGYVEHIVLNDADPFIYAFWHSVVNYPDAFVEKIRETPVTMESRAYFQSVLQHPASDSSLEKGFAAFFLNRTSRSGILTGGVIGGNDQTGSYKIDARFNKENLISRVEAIGRMHKHITVLGTDALSVVADLSPSFPENTTIFMDPPYYVQGSRLYRKHYQTTQHAEIARCVQYWDKPILITYDDVHEIRELYKHSGMDTASLSLRYSTTMNRPVVDELVLYANLELPEPIRHAA